VPGAPTAEVDPADAEAERDEAAAARAVSEDDEEGGAVQPPAENGAARDGGTGDGEGEGDEANLSLAAMESQLKPQVLEKFDEIAGVYKKMHRLQDKRMETLHAGRLFSPASEKHYMKLKQELIELLMGVRLNNGRIEQLVEHTRLSIHRELHGDGRPHAGRAGTGRGLATRIAEPPQQDEHTLKLGRHEQAQ